MVDATASFDGKRLAASHTSPPTLPRNAAGPSVSIAAAEGPAAYATVWRSAPSAPPQTRAWGLNWAAEVKPDLLIARLELEGKPAFALAREVVKRGPLRVAQFMGGRHANGNFCAAEPQWLASGDLTAIRSMFA